MEIFTFVFVKADGTIRGYACRGPRDRVVKVMAAQARSEADDPALIISAEDFSRIILDKKERRAGWIWSSDVMQWYGTFYIVELLPCAEIDRSAEIKERAANTTKLLEELNQRIKLIKKNN